MSETAKTLIFLVLAAVVLLGAWVAKPAMIQSDALDDSGERFFDEFDPLSAKSLEIVSFDEGSGKTRAFKVAQQNGRWSIPSRENYPADAQEHLSQAATSVMGLRKGPAVSDSQADHDLFGVADPTVENAGPGAGTRVTMKDEGSKTLVDLIVGKPVKDTQQLRYVRVAGRDRVYTVQVNTQPLTTKFEDWIERDLLKLQPFLMTEVILDDYSIDEVNRRIVRGDRLNVHWESAGKKWHMDDLAPNEALKTEKLDELRNALRDLRIIDVHRKPKGLSAQLQGQANIELDAEAMASLMSRGYYIVENGLKSNQGETIARTSEGVEYTLRFGEIVTVEGSADIAGAEGESAASSQTGRYVFVTAHFDPNLIEQPKLDPVPEIPPPASATQPEGAEPATQPATDPAAEQARAAIIAANQKKIDEHQKKVADGQKRVNELNARFADWYYVVSDTEYQKIRLCRADVVGPADAQPAATPESGMQQPPIQGLPR